MPRIIAFIQALINQVPHWMLLVFAAGVGAVLSYFQAEPNAQILSALTSWTVALPMLKGAMVAFVGTVIALLKTAPWSGSASGGGSVTALPSSELRTVPPKAPSMQRRRGSRAVPILSLGFVLAIAALCAGCFSTAPTVPVTPANSDQVSSCQSIASVHNGVVIGDFAVGGLTTGLASVGAAVSDPSTKNGLVIGAAIAGAVAVVGTGIAGYTGQEFVNGNCSSVVGPLPAADRDGGQ